MFFRREAERILRDFLKPEPVAPRTEVRVSADVFEDDAQVVVEVELPGVSRDDVALYILRDRLIIEGRKRDGRAVEGDEKERPSFLCAERNFGAFERVVQLESPVDTSRIAARLEQGVLCITLPKIDDRRGKKRRVAID
jgi:HSP20 family protein